MATASVSVERSELRETALADTEPAVYRRRAPRQVGDTEYLRSFVGGSETPAVRNDPTEEPVGTAAGEKAQDYYLVGESPAMQRVFREIRRFGGTDAPVLITGESGTGKELAALAIHERSSYKSGPYIPINCAGLPPTLISSELFGYERGAFTGASHRKIGWIEAANGGTVFLDEIGDLPLDLQPHLLRFLQDRTIHRVGGRAPVTDNVRVIAATNKDLAAEVRAGRFREDLFYRLHVLTLHMPPLRDRETDIALLTMFFLQRFAAEMGRPALRLTEDAQAAIDSHAWPGNVRELISRVRRAVVMVEGDVISAHDLGFSAVERRRTVRVAPAVEVEAAASKDAGNPDALFELMGGDMTLAKAKAKLEEWMVRQALLRCRACVTSAAQQLGISRVTFYRLMEKHAIRSDLAGIEPAAEAFDSEACLGAPADQ